MGGGRKPNHQKTRIGVTEPWYTTSPVDVISVGGALLLADLFTPFDQPRTLTTIRYIVGKNRQG